MATCEMLRPLDGALQSAELRQPDAIENEVAQRFQHLLKECLTSAEEPSTSGRPALPVLFQAKPHANSLRGLLQRQARLRKLQAQHELLLEEGDLRRIVALLEAHAEFEVTSTGIAEDGRINYDGFSQVATECLALFGPGVGPYFQASTFLKFDRDGNGTIPLSLFVQYVTQHAGGLQLRGHLSFYDEAGSGILTAGALERYLHDCAQECPALADMDPGFLPHYCRIAARKLLFFHGHRASNSGGSGSSMSRGGSGAAGGEACVRIRDLLNSPVMMELQELRAVGPGAEEDMPDLSSNWFSLQSTQRVYNTFQSWDADLSGGLSRSEFSRISQGTMSELFISRVFEEHVCIHRGEHWPPPPPRRRLLLPATLRSGAPSAAAAAANAGVPGAGTRDEMDMMAFVDFVLAWDHRNHPASLPYFFAIFDLSHSGAIRLSDVYTFFKEIHVMWVAMGEYSDLSVYDIIDEIIDMVKPTDPQRGLTPQELQSCKMAGTVFSILANVDQFYQYNYREQFMHSEEQ